MKKKNFDHEKPLNENLSEELKLKLQFFKYAHNNHLKSYQRDRLVALLVKKFKFSPFKAGILGLGIAVLTYMIGYILYFLLNQDIAGITKTGIDIIYDFSLIPLVFGYYVWISTEPPYVFLKLQENGISFESEKQYNDFVSKNVNNIINNKFIYIFSVLAALFMTTTILYAASTGSEVWGPRDANYLVFYALKVPITWGIPWYMVCVIFIKETLSIWVFRNMLKKADLKIDMFHEDRCGGLKPISDYLLTYMYFLMACGFGFVLLVTRSTKFGYFQQAYIVNFCLLLYLVFTCFYFFFPLHPVHKLMKSLREDIQARIEWEGYLPNRPFTPAIVSKFALATCSPIVLFFFQS